MAPANFCLTVARVEGLKGEDPSRVLFGVGIYGLLLALAFCSRPLSRRGGGAFPDLIQHRRSLQRSFSALGTRSVGAAVPIERGIRADRDVKCPRTDDSVRGRHVSILI